MRTTACLVGCLLAFLVAPSAHAGTIALKDLTPEQAAALQASEQRLATFDRALQVLDDRRAHRQISASDYNRQEREMVSYIAGEAEFQNAILQKQSGAAPFMISSEQGDKIKEGCAEAAAIIGQAGLRMLSFIH